MKVVSVVVKNVVWKSEKVSKRDILEVRKGSYKVKKGLKVV